LNFAARIETHGQNAEAAEFIVAARTETFQTSRQVKAEQAQQLTRG
jgi:hypothetical protein